MINHDISLQTAIQKESDFKYRVHSNAHLFPEETRYHLIQIDLTHV